MLKGASSTLYGAKIDFARQETREFKVEFENKMSKNVDSHQINFLALSPFFLKIFRSLVARVSQVVSKLEQHIFFYDSHTQTGRTY